MLSKDATELNDHSDFSAEQSIQVRALTAGYMLIIRGRRRRRLVPLAASQPASQRKASSSPRRGWSVSHSHTAAAGWLDDVVYRNLYPQTICNISRSSFFV